MHMAGPSTPCAKPFSCGHEQHRLRRYRSCWVNAYKCADSTRVRSIKNVFEQESSDSDADEEIQKHRRGVSTAASTSVNSDRHSLATSDQVCAVLCIRSTACSVFNSTFGLLLTTRISLQVEQVRLELSKVREQLAQVLTHSHVLER